MKAKLINDAAERVFLLVYGKGDDVLPPLQSFAEGHGVSAGHFTAIGAFQRATLGFFAPHRKDYAPIKIDDQVEVLSLVGNIALHEGKPKVHAHVVIGKADGTAHGGHLLSATVWPTLEVILTESPRHLQRRFDVETGLPLIVLDSQDSVIP